MLCNLFSGRSIRETIYRLLHLNYTNIIQLVFLVDTYIIILFNRTLNLSSYSFLRCHHVLQERMIPGPVPALKLSWSSYSSSMVARSRSTFKEWPIKCKGKSDVVERFTSIFQKKKKKIHVCPWHCHEHNAENYFVRMREGSLQKRLIGSEVGAGFLC